RRRRAGAGHLPAAAQRAAAGVRRVRVPLAPGRPARGRHPDHAHVEVSPMSRRTVTMNIDGGLSVSRKLSQLSGQLPWIQRRAMATLRRRLPVYARRDMQAEYNIGARRVNQDLSSRIDGDTIKLTGHWRGIGLMNFGARETRKGVTASIMRGRRSL